ncbi:MAG TPA: nuclear transport factor 2 family protein [Gemmatimonadales bacterium]|jgi:ketosteroid isomerase-like protein|nr:nuclear transport factor 2 family protein [Gemmatimonadales bacterium]
MRQPILGALLGTALVACGGGTAPVVDPVAEAAVSARFDAWVKAWNLHDPAALAPFYSHQEHLTVVWPTGERTRGWTQESQFQQSFLPTVTVMNLVPQTPRIQLVRKNLAFVGFPFTLDLAAGGSRQIGLGQGMLLWQHEDGAWRLYAAQLSYTKATEAQVIPQRRR